MLSSFTHLKPFATQRWRRRTIVRRSWSLKRWGAEIHRVWLGGGAIHMTATTAVFLGGFYLVCDTVERLAGFDPHTPVWLWPIECVAAASGLCVLVGDCTWGLCNLADILYRDQPAPIDEAMAKERAWRVRQRLDVRLPTAPAALTQRARL